MSNETLSPIQTELLSRADSIFASISGAVNKATDFASVQIPDIAIQYVAYGRAYVSFMMLVNLSLLLSGLFLLIFYSSKNIHNWPNDFWDQWGSKRIMSTLIGLAFTVAGFMNVMLDMAGFMMVWFAPKIWLITELAKLIKMVK